MNNNYERALRARTWHFLGRSELWVESYEEFRSMDRVAGSRNVYPIGTQACEPDKCTALYILFPYTFSTILT
eukprot:scaffold33521_cov130-Skeletonema_dohrnii-CCMP3373.AAC.3